MKVYAKASEKLQYILWEVSRFYPMARNFHERLSLLWFLLIFHVSYRIPRRFQGRDVTILLQGAQYVVGLGTGEFGILRELYCDRVYDRCADFIPTPGWTVFDIGANVGLFTVQQASRGARVIAFEPNRNCYRRLTKTIMANGLTDQVDVFNCAMGSMLGPGKMIVRQVSGLEGTTTGAVIPAAEADDLDGSDVSIVSLDHVVPSLGISRIHLLKIDVEGAEIDVLRGAACTLDLVDRIVLEYHSSDLLEQVCKLISDCGFVRVLQLDSDGEAGVGILYAKRVAAAM